MLYVLHIITNFSALGGAEMMLSRLIKSQPDVQHHLISLMGINEELYADTLNECCSYRSLKWNGINTLIVISELRKIIKELNPNIVQGWMYHANVITSLSLLGFKKKPKFFWGIHHSLAAPQEESLSTKIALNLSKILSKHPMGVIYCANSSRIQHINFGFKQKNNIVIPNGVALDKFSINLKIFEPCIIGFAGRYHKAKGYSYLFEVINELKDYPIFFKIAGQGASLENSAIVEYFNKYQLDQGKVQLLGQVTNMKEFYNSINLFLMTSITEGFPNVLVEAMASGIPCVTTDVGDAKYIVDQYGFVASSGNIQQIKKHILSYLNLNNNEKEKLKKDVRTRVEDNFSIEQVSQQYRDAWKNI